MSAFLEGVNKCLPSLFYGTAFSNLLLRHRLNVDSWHNLSPKNGLEGISWNLPKRRI